MKKCYTCGEYKDPSSFNKNKVRKDGLNSICRECSKVRSKQYYKENPVKHKAEVTKHRKIYTAKAQTLIAEYLLANPCVECGESDIRCLEFDHLRDKEDCVSTALKNRWAFDRLKKEMDKCQILCANCHRKKTHRDSNSYKYKYYAGVAQR